ncbi:GGDEF domain-containing protein [Polymorphum gilvum]|uniref:GGDEF domain-containing protein n=1 Tax=Polymorphum gilvum TaxID=991904 RepID=UPI0011D1ECE5|nr:GGDEF domain-containing protein [Polymorphum gilvum]
MAGATLLLVWLPSRTQAWLRSWAISFLVRVPGFLLLAMRGDIPDRISIDLANALLMLGVGIGHAGARQFGDRPVLPPAVVAPMIVWLAACQVPALYEDSGMRVFVQAILLAAYGALIAWEFWRCSGESRLLRGLLVTIFALNAVTQALRGWFGLVNGLPASLPIPDDGLVLTLSVPMLVALVGVLIGIALHRDQVMRGLRREADIDYLTGALNRRSFELHAGQALRQSSSVRRAFLLLDLDHFKAVNDTLGHDAGDRVLVDFSREVRSRVGAGACFGRIGGDEFALLVPVSDALAAERLAEDLCRLVSGMTVASPDGDWPLSVSIGIAMAGPADDLEQLMRWADRALYAAKAAGRSRVEHLTPALVAAVAAQI